MFISREWLQLCLKGVMILVKINSDKKNCDVNGSVADYEGNKDVYLCFTFQPICVMRFGC